MRLAYASFTALVLSCVPSTLCAGPAGTKITGKVTVIGALPKTKSFDLSREPVCAKLHAAQPLFPETVLTGPGSSLRNVVVYVSTGAPPSKDAPGAAVTFDQIDCRYATHVLAFRIGQEVKISNSDPLSHNVHPLAKANREWNKLQLPGTPPFSYSFDSEEFIPVKCNLHSWMQGYFVVLKTSFFAVTGDDGRFELPELPPGHYTVTAWHESLGTRSQEIVIGSPGEGQTVNFTFSARP